MSQLGIFGRTALLVYGALATFTIVAWLSIMNFGALPGIEATANVLSERARVTVDAARAGAPLPSNATLATEPPPSWAVVPRPPSGIYVRTLVRALRERLPGADVAVVAAGYDSRVWVRVPDWPGHWISLAWPIAPPAGGLYVLALLIGVALLLALPAAAFAQRLAAPLRALSAAAGRLAAGEHVSLATMRGPPEVRALTASFETMASKLREAESRRELMLAGISHDLRTPLARMRVAVEMLAGAGEPLRREFVADIEELDALVARFLAFVRAAHHETPTECVPDEIVRQAVARRASFAAAELDLNASAPVRLPAGGLAQIVGNLLDNAIDHGRPPVRVATAFDAGALRLTVADGGQGIPDDAWEDALQPFGTGGGVPREGHSGLGLATVSRLVQVAGGTLRSSRRDACFEIVALLPIAHEVGR